MKLSEALNHYPTILENGPLGTRLKYQYQFESPPHLIVEQVKGREALTEIYMGDIAVAKAIFDKTKTRLLRGVALIFSFGFSYALSDAKNLSHFLNILVLR